MCSTASRSPNSSEHARSHVVDDPAQLLEAADDLAFELGELRVACHAVVAQRRDLPRHAGEIGEASGRAGPWPCGGAALHPFGQASSAHPQQFLAAARVAFGEHGAARLVGLDQREDVRRDEVGALLSDADVDLGEAVGLVAADVERADVVPRARIGTMIRLRSLPV